MRLIVPFIVLMAALAGVACLDDTGPDADVVIVNRGEVFTLDPQRMSYLQDFRLAYALYEGLLRWNNRDLSIEPAAADLPEISPDGLTYTFHIAPAARWSNGDAVTAHDFAYAWSRLLWPDTAADYSNLFFVIDGAEDFFRWRSAQLAKKRDGSDLIKRDGSDFSVEQAQRRFEQTVAIHALDDRTLQVRLVRPCAYFLELVCFAPAAPVHRPSVEGWPDGTKLVDAERGWAGVAAPPWPQRRFLHVNPASGRLEQRHDWARPGRLVSNGPYVLDQWRYKRDLRLRANPFYHRPQIMRNRSVLLRSIDDANTAVLAFESGSVDWLGDVGVEYAPDMLSRAAAGLEGQRTIHALPTFGTDFFSFNCRPALPDGRPNPFADARVRRAFALAVDRAAIVRSATRLDEPLAGTLIPPGAIRGYESPGGLPFDAQRARAELAAAGWTDRDNDGAVENARGEPFPAVDLLYTTNSPRYQWMALELKSQWEQRLGVRIALRGADTKFYKEDLKLGKFMIARGRWYGDYGDPMTFLQINRSGDGNNDRGFHDPRFDAMLDAATGQRDPARRMALLRDAERYLCQEQLPLVPICQLVQLYMYDPQRLSGLTHHPRLIQYLWELQRSGGA